jgi:single-strand DNA-binding protein
MARRKSTSTTAVPEAQAPAPAAEENTSNEDQTVLQGRLTRDPELRKTNSGRSVTTLRIAVNHPDADTDFIDVVAWNRTAEVVCQFLKKGRLVEVTGRSQERTYTANDGTDRTVTEISAYRVQFLTAQPTAQSPDQEVAA